ncbi:hypothetical protein ACWEBX_37975 [Streptomyces sp. NPDC005070]
MTQLSPPTTTAPPAPDRPAARTRTRPGPAHRKPPVLSSLTGSCFALD